MSRNFKPGETFKQFVSFAGVGAIATSTHYVVLVILVEIYSTKETLASTWGYAFGAFVNYALNYRFTFRSDQPHQVAIARFLAIAVVGMALNSLVVFTLVNNSTFYYFVA